MKERGRAFRRPIEDRSPPESGSITPLAFDTRTNGPDHVHHENGASNLDSESNGSSILSPAAEFLGSFSSSRSGRDRAGTNASHFELPLDRSSIGTAREDFLRQSHSSWSRSFIAPDPDEEGEQVDGYTLEKTLGHGTFSTVKQARHNHSGNLVAVKIVRHHSSQSAARGYENQAEGPAMSSSMLSTASSPGNSRHQHQAESASARIRSCSSPSVNLQPTFGSTEIMYHESSDVEGLPASSSDGLGIASNDALIAFPVSPSHSCPEDDQYNGDHRYASRADPAIQKEVIIWSQLDPHPHIVPLLQFYESDFASFSFMPLCSGNLLQYVKDYGRGGTKSPEQPATAAFAASPPSAANISASGSPPLSSSTSSLSRVVSHRSSSSSTSNSGSSNKPHRSSSIRLRHPGEIVSGGAGLPLDCVTTIFAQIVSGLQYLHLEASVTHKDIKLENILLDKSGENFQISDFGLAHTTVSDDYAKDDARLRRLQMESKARRERASSDVHAHESLSGPDATNFEPFSSFGTAASLILPYSSSSPSTDYAFNLSASTPASGFASHRSRKHAIPTSLFQVPTSRTPATAGSLQYTSPEQIRSPSPLMDASVDIWALGCVLYAMIDGKLPFEDGFEPRLRVSIMKGEWRMPQALKSQPPNSQMAIDGEPSALEKAMIEKVLRGCLQIDPLERWTIQQVAQSEWLKDAVLRTSPARGRMQNGTRIVPAYSRSRSRGRPQGLERDTSKSSIQSPSSSGRRGPSMEEYRRARGDIPNSPSTGSRSTSSQRRYGRDSSSGWEIL